MQTLAFDGHGALAREVVEAQGEQIMAHPIGTGPFDELMQSLVVEPPRARLPISSPLPSYRAVLARVKSFPWLTVSHHNHLSAKRRIAMASVLSPTELRCAALILANGGTATTSELVAAVRQTGTTESAARMMLRTTPILVKCKRAAFALRGRLPAVASLRAAAGSGKRAFLRLARRAAICLQPTSLKLSMTRS